MISGSTALTSKVISREHPIQLATSWMLENVAESPTIRLAETKLSASASQG